MVLFSTKEIGSKTNRKFLKKRNIKMEFTQVNFLMERSRVRENSSMLTAHTIKANLKMTRYGVEKEQLNTLMVQSTKVILSMDKKRVKEI